MGADLSADHRPDGDEGDDRPLDVRGDDEQQRGEQVDRSGEHVLRVTNAHERLRRAPLLALERKAARLTTAHARLGALSPLATLDRGYAIVRRGDDVVRAASDVGAGDALSVRVADGSFGAVVK